MRTKDCRSAKHRVPFVRLIAGTEMTPRCRGVLRPIYSQTKAVLTGRKLPLTAFYNIRNRNGEVVYVRRISRRSSEREGQECHLPGKQPPRRLRGSLLIVATGIQ
jgi:hypothetical protein